MGKMDRTVTRKLDMNAPEFAEANMMIFEGSPQECFKVMRHLRKQAMRLSNGDFDVDAPLRRDVVKKFYRDKNNELVEIA
jgi:hypothetical protein